MTPLKAKRILRDAIEHLRPLAVGDTQKGIAPNAEALAISTLAQAMVKVVTEKQTCMEWWRQLDCKID